MNRGMTLTSLMVAVALSGIIAVFGSRLVVNQMFMAATAELIDQGDTVMSFYVNALRDRKVWRCTLFDTGNEDFRKLVLGGVGTTAQVSLRDPRCKSLTSITPTTIVGVVDPLRLHEWRNHPILSGSDRGEELLPKAGKYVGDSIAGSDVGASDGWWKINLEAKQAGGKGDVDMILKLCLQESVYVAKHKKRKQVPRAYRYVCPPVTLPRTSEYMIRRVRYSENAIKKNTCSANKAIISVGDRSQGLISTTCSDFKLLRIGSPPSAYELDPLGERTDRQAMKPSSCITRDNVHRITGRHPAIGTDGNGNLICPTNQVLLHSLGVGTDDSGANGGSLCGRETVIDRNWRGIDTTRNLDLVVCGINKDGTIRCCSRKGPKGPDGLKGCPASKKYAVKGCPLSSTFGPTSDSAVAEARRYFGNSSRCPTLPNPLPANGVPTCSSEQ